MRNEVSPDACWSTASFGEAATTRPQELRALGEHLLACRGGGSRMFRVQCGVDALNGFVISRPFTSLALVALLTVVGVMAL